MSYLGALEKVKQAVAAKDLVPHLTHFLIKGGRIFASDGNMTAGAPFPSDDTYMVPAKDFERVLTRLGDKSTIEVDENAIIIKQGRYKSRINTLDPSDFHFAEPVGTICDDVEELAAAFRKLRPFVSDNATRPFAMGFRLREHDATVTNNIVLARVLIELPVDMDHLVPVWCADFVLSRKDPVREICYDEVSFSCTFKDGSWVRSPLIAEAFPDEVADKLLGDFKRPKWKITDDWREVYTTISELCEEGVRVLPDRITGSRGQSDTAGEVKTPIKEPSSWHPKFLTPVIGSATHIDFGAYPRPAPWAGDGIVGVCAGRTA